MPRHLYFAYGSNLSIRQMQERCPSSRVIGASTLRGYRLCFPRQSKKRWGGGVAGIEPAADGVTEGALYEIDDADLAALDGYEGVAQHHYHRIEIDAALTDGSVMRAWTYVANPEIGGPFAASAKYAAVIQTGAREHGLSADLIARMQAYIDAEKVR